MTANKVLQTLYGGAAASIAPHAILAILFLSPILTGGSLSQAEMSGGRAVLLLEAILACIVVLACGSVAFYGERQPQPSFLPLPSIVFILVALVLYFHRLESATMIIFCVYQAGLTLHRIYSGDINIVAAKREASRAFLVVLIISGTLEAFGDGVATTKDDVHFSEHSDLSANIWISFCALFFLDVAFWFFSSDKRPPANDENTPSTQGLI